VLPSVGDKNAFVGICTLSEYFPSSLKIIQLASAVVSIQATCPKRERRRDLTIAESGGCWVIWQIWSFLTKSNRRTSRILRRYQWSTASIWRASAILNQHSGYRKLSAISYVDCLFVRTSQTYLKKLQKRCDNVAYLTVVAASWMLRLTCISSDLHHWYTSASSETSSCMHMHCSSLSRW